MVYDGTNLQVFGASETSGVSLISSASFSAGALNLGNSWSLFLGNRLARDRAFSGQLDDVRFYVGAASSSFLAGIRQQALTAPATSDSQAVAPGITATPSIDGSELLLRITAVQSRRYILEAASDLGANATWTPVSTNIGADSVLTNTVPVDPREPARFFRYQVQ
jgi:hypothetical protein